MYIILGAIFALFLSFAQAKHAWIRAYYFSSGDCSGPPIMGNVDVPRDVCESLIFGGSSMRLTETTLGDWTREINAGATGCYLYAFTQLGCYERYLDLILDPADVMNLCIPSRDANDPFFSLSFTCIYGEPPRRRRTLPAAANRTTNELNMTNPDVASAYLRGRALVDELRKFNGTTRFNNSIASGPAQNSYNATSITINSGNSSMDGPVQNISIRSVNHQGPAFISRERNANLTRKANHSSPVSARSVNFHGPALINGKPNSNYSHKLTARESDDEPSIASGILYLNSTHNINNSRSESPVEPIGARSVNYHGSALIDEEPNLNSSCEYKDSKPGDHVQLGNNTNGHHELADVNRVPITNVTRAQIHSAGTQTIDDSNRDVDYSEDDSDWSDDDFDANRNEYESYRNSTSLDKRDSINLFWEGPTRSLWMLHPWTGSILCYKCFAKAADDFGNFQCRWGYKIAYMGDCGDKPLAPIYTSTITVQPVVTVTPLPGQQSIQKRSWHMPVLLSNPWYPGITVCALAEWEGRNKRWKQSVKIEEVHKKLYKCDKSPIAQNIMVWARTETYTAPVKTVTATAQQLAQTIIKTVIITPEVAPTWFESILVPTPSVVPSKSTPSASVSILRASDFRDVTTVLAAVAVPTTSVGTVSPPIEPTPVSSLPVISHVGPAGSFTSASIGFRPPDKTTSTTRDYFTSTTVGVRPTDVTEATPQLQPRHKYLGPTVGGFSTVIISRSRDTP
ncbi:uncharacterized protein yc1106_04896 [Curvularia clavata]|uniref:Uncharacterized protein n=1 Tax=Curvularia clavata TaxID=95742 RepID=A0A9Q8Z765_CURCL|nr:uncharacterized protein yc1106_04896 [Curvularia clavata]